MMMLSSDAAVGVGVRAGVGVEVEVAVEVGAIHGRLRAIGRDRAELDAVEAHWIRAGHAVRIWEAYGHASYAAYLEEVLGYGRKTARERIRTALVLAELPGIEAALAEGQVAWTHVRELSRVATGDTEEAWLAAVKGQRAREVAERVAGLSRGERPGAIADRSRVPRTLVFEVSPETYAMVREAIRVARQSGDGSGHGSGDGLVDDDAALAMIARGFLAGGGGGDAGRPGYQVAVSRCDDCGRVFAEADGASVQLDPAMVAAIDCDHTRVPASLEGRASQTIPPAVRRAVVAAFHHRCAVPGCGNATWLDVHHIWPRARGGGHVPGNLLLLCSTHHRLIHEGRLGVERVGGRLVFRRAEGSRYRSAVWRGSDLQVPG